MRICCRYANLKEPPCCCRRYRHLDHAQDRKLDHVKDQPHTATQALAAAATGALEQLEEHGRRLQENLRRISQVGRHRRQENLYLEQCPMRRAEDHRQRHRRHLYQLEHQ